MISLSTGSATDVGCVRQGNEDSVLVADPIFAVADGMGGYAGGATASAIAVVHLQRLSQQATITSDDVYRALTEANDEIVERGQSDVETLGMGTTVAGLALVQNGGSDYWLVFNVGDSRVYRFADDRLDQVSVDHSYTQELVEEGRITAEEALTHPERNVVTRALGSEPDVAPDLWLMAPESGETYLLCSDGLTRELTVRQMEYVLRSTDDPQAACDLLVAAALEAGGRDNVSVVVVRVGAAPLPDEATTPPSILRAAARELGVVTADEVAEGVDGGRIGSDAVVQDEPETVLLDDDAVPVDERAPGPEADAAAIISDVPAVPVSEEGLTAATDVPGIIEEVPGG